MAPPGMLVHKITVVFIVIIIYGSYGSSTDNFCQTAGPCCSRCLIKGYRAYSLNIREERTHGCKNIENTSWL